MNLRQSIFSFGYKRVFQPKSICLASKFTSQQRKTHNTATVKPPAPAQMLEPTASLTVGSIIRIQNMFLLCQQLRLQVVVKVYEASDSLSKGPAGSPSSSPKAPRDAVSEYYVVVSVHHDHAFMKYYANATVADMVLLRGMMLQVVTDPGCTELKSARVHQAFLPKFENEGSDMKTAGEIVAQADRRYMVVSVKHSGSLVTLSHTGFAAKNSVSNTFTAGAAMCLRAHFMRVLRERRDTSALDDLAPWLSQGPKSDAALEKKVDEHLKRLLEYMKSKSMAFSFEMVTGSHGNHGQLPAGEYLVTTSAHVPSPTDPGDVLFLSPTSLARECLAWGLPTNDVWLFAGGSTAAAARELLDNEALMGRNTHSILRALDDLAEATSNTSIRLRGTYPHDDWQGSRVEGFVISQGQPITEEARKELLELSSMMHERVIESPAKLPSHMVAPFASLLEAPVTSKSAMNTSSSPPSSPAQSNGNAATARTGSPPASPVRLNTGSTAAVAQTAGGQRGSPPANAASPGRLGAGNAAAGMLNAGPQRGSPPARPAQAGGYAAAVAQGTGGQKGDRNAKSVTPPNSPSNLGNKMSPDRGMAPALAVNSAETAKKESDPKGIAPEWLLNSVCSLNAGWLPPTFLVPVAPERKDSVYDLLKSWDAHKYPLLLDSSSSSGTHPGQTRGSEGGAQAKVQKLDSCSGVFVSLGGGSTVLYRKAMQSLSVPQLADVLCSAVASGVVADPQKAQALLTELLGRDMKSDTKTTPSDQVRAALALAGPSRTSAGLRYKKKMTGWSSEPDGEVGYCLMTFMIRNGLTALRHGVPTYLAYVAGLTRTWGLPKSNQDKVMQYARSWAAWAAKHGGAAAIQEQSYLTVAEPFTKAFLAAGGKMDLGATPGLSARAEGAFQGLLVLIDAPPALLEAVKKALDLRVQLDPNKLDGAVSKSVLADGAVLPLPMDKPMNKLPTRFAEDWAKYTWVVAAKTDGVDRKAAGQQQTKVQRFSAALANEFGSSKQSQRIKYINLMDGTKPSVDSILSWVGPGLPVPPPGPAVITSFVSIPGCGKTSMLKGLDLTAAALTGEVAKGAVAVDVQTFNSDIMKSDAKFKNVPSARYWNHLASVAADASESKERVSVVVADKNLVPSPPGNFSRVSGILRYSGGASTRTLAVVPVVTGPSAMSDDSTVSTPWPLEMMALCIMRVLKRVKHEGGLDESLPSASAVVMLFASWFGSMTLPGLVSKLSSHFDDVRELPIATLPPAGGAVPADVLEHIAMGLATVNDSSKPPLPPAWESRMRQLITRADTQAALMAMQRPIGDVQKDLALIFQESANAAVSGPAEVRENSATPCYVAVTGFPAETVKSLQQQLPLPPGSALRLKPQLHVTLWHPGNPEHADMRDFLMACAGEQVVVEVDAIDVSPEVAAARVSFVSGPSAIMSLPSTHPSRHFHITLALAPGTKAVEANKLAARVENPNDTAKRIVLSSPLQLEGSVTLLTA